MRKLIIAGITFVLLLGGYIVYMEIDKRTFIDSISSVSPVVDQPVNVLAPPREVTQANEEPKSQKIDPAEIPAEILDAVNRVPEQFGYSDASITYAKLESKVMSGEKLTIDERVASLEATFRLWPNEATRRSLILAKWVQSKGSNFPPRDGYSDEDLAELKELGIPVVYRGDAMIINPLPDYIRDEEPSDPASDTVFSEGIGEDTDFPQFRSEVSPVMPEPKIPVTTDHVHHEDRHVHESTTLGHGTDSEPPTPADAKSVEASGWEGLSQEQREQAKQFFDQYGTEEGLRRFREMDPEAARQFERERRKPPVPSESNDVPSTR